MKPLVVKMSDGFKGTTFAVRATVVRDWRFWLGMCFLRLACLCLRSRLTMAPPEWSGGSE